MPEPAPPQPKRRVEVRVPESYRKVSEEVWQELESYLCAGFLTATAAIEGQRFAFKTVNHHELRMIELTRPPSLPVDGRSAFRDHFIAYSVFAVNGENALFQRPRHVRRLVKMVSLLPGLVLDKVLENLAALNERASRLYPLVEVYAYENRSRFRWMHSRGSPVHSPMNTGIPGTEELGMTACQQMWTALNRIIDRREEVERDWSHAKFVGSCFAGKGMRAIDERDRSRLEKERVDREDLKMRVLYQYLNRTADGKEPEPTVALPDGRQATVFKKFKAESAEELAEELSAALSGELDHHDRVIAEKRREMQARADEVDRQRMRVFSAPGPLPGAGSRILGGRAQAEEYLRLLGARREERMERARRGALSGPDAEEASDEGEVTEP